MRATPSALVINLPHLLYFPAGQGSAATPALRAISSRGWRGVALSSDRGAASKFMTEAEMEQKAEKRQGEEEEGKEEGEGSKGQKSVSLTPALSPWLPCSHPLRTALETV